MLLVSNCPKCGFRNEPKEMKIGDNFNCNICGHAWIPDIDNMAVENPKHIQAMKDGKAPLEFLLGDVVDEPEARVLAYGAAKYGVRNWRIDKITASTYEGAFRRHLNAWLRGEDIDPESGEPHLAHIRANCAVVMDAQKVGTFIDNRDRAESENVNATNEE